ncbi:hypothetical protein ACIQAL_21770 [Pseudomonas sp. NPDC088368]|uniref:hypothetical protein n=1 Tax=Pseudomonas sp. NPDC088368 TaxID=3364453 RepID=UPI0037F47C29
MSESNSYGALLPEGFSNVIEELFQRLKDARSAEQLMTRAIRCDDFIQASLKAGSITEEDAERLNAMFDQALGQKIQVLIPR